MELIEAYKGIEKNLVPTNEELGFKKKNDDETTILFEGKKGAYRLVHDKDTNILELECAYNVDGQQSEFNTVSRSLFELDVIDERDSQHQTRLLTNLKNSLRSTSLSILTRLRCQNQFQEQRQRTVL